MVFTPAQDGRWVDDNYARLAEVVHDYDNYLQLRWIPPEHRTRNDKKPYVIVDTRTESPVLYASELDTPQEILTSLFMGDNKRGDVLARMEAMEAAQKALQYKEQMEQYEQAADEAKFLLQTPLNSIRFNGKILDGHELRVKGHIRERKVF